MACWFQQKSTILAILLMTIISINSQLVSSDDSAILSSRVFSCVMATNATISYQNNRNILLSYFTAQSPSQTPLFYNTSAGNSTDSIFGYYMCRGDVTPELCHSCILNGTRMGNNCEYQDGIFFSEKCVYRYANHSMYGTLDLRLPSTFSSLGSNVSNYQQFNRTLSATLSALIDEAAFGSTGFATREASVAQGEANVTGDERIYTLAQCTPDILGVNCSTCLRSALSDLRSCCDGYQGGFVTLASCQLRYDNRSFYDLDEIMNSSAGKGVRPVNYLVVYLVLFLFMYYSFLLLE